MLYIYTYNFKYQFVIDDNKKNCQIGTEKRNYGRMQCQHGNEKTFKIN